MSLERESTFEKVSDLVLAGAHWSPGEDRPIFKSR